MDSLIPLKVNSTGSPIESGQTGETSYLGRPSQATPGIGLGALGFHPSVALEGAGTSTQSLSSVPGLLKSLASKLASEISLNFSDSD